MNDAIVIINDDLEIEADYMEAPHQVWVRNTAALIGSVVVDTARPDVIADGNRIVNWRPAKFGSTWSSESR